jgi:HlyD family secretion protein
MNLEKIRRVAPIVVFVGLVVAGLIYLTVVSTKGNGPLQASGTVEAVEVSVASEVSGRVEEVLVEEGASVEAGDVLLRLDSRLLEAQRELALASGQAAVAAAELELVNAQQALDALFENASLAAAQAELALANARDALDHAERMTTYLEEGKRPIQETLDEAEAALALAEDAVDRAQAAYDGLVDLPENDPTRVVALAALEAARRERAAAEASLNWYRGEAPDIDLAVLDGKVSLAQAQLNQAERNYEDVVPGPDPDLLGHAQARLTLARAQLAAARAEAEVDAETLDLQLEKLLVRAPLSGVVMARSIEPGEVLLAGARALSIGQTDQLTITVFIPEDRYGQIDLGDHVKVSVDSFPEETFDAVVTRIADEAEFTPRNVQTEEGRRTTVFAVELTVTDPGGKLKPGMPADVTFGA